MIWIPCSVKPKKGEERGGERGESERKKGGGERGKGKVVWEEEEEGKSTSLLHGFRI